MLCRTKAGTLRLVWNGEEILLDPNGRDLPDALAESIRPHVNVMVDECMPEVPDPETARAPDPEPELPRRKPKAAVDRE
jgi:hypothetical protein